MTPIKSTCLAIIIALAPLVFGGCAAFKAHKIPKAGDLSPRSQSGLRMKCFTSCEQIGVKKSFDKVLMKSNCFTLVDKPNEADILVSLTFRGKQTRGIHPIIGGLSLMTIPSWFVHTIQVDADVTFGGLKRTYNIEDSATFVMWLPMVFAAPFNSPFSVDEDVNQNIYKTLVLKMNEDGFVRK